MKQLSILTIFLLFVGVSIQAQESEKATIIQVIESEHQAFADRDYDKWISHYDQSDNLLFGNATQYAAKGFEEMSEKAAAYYKANPAKETARIGYDYEVTIVKDRARVTFTQKGADGKDISKELRILVKKEGQWKITGMIFFAL